MIAKTLKAIFDFGPLLFAAGFLLPLFAELIALSGWTPPFGLSTLAIGAIPALAFGLYAQIRGTWLW
ncbi:MAG: hypothetical protein AAGK23_08565 [Pseudomonadota bacterium]